MYRFFLKAWLFLMTDLVRLDRLFIFAARTSRSYEPPGSAVVFLWNLIAALPCCFSVCTFRIARGKQATRDEGPGGARPKPTSKLLDRN